MPIPQAGLACPQFLSDACIIDEQKEHLVIAVRVPKRLVSENVAFLGALSDCSAGDNVTLAPQFKSRVSRKRIRTAAYSLAIAGGIALGMSPAISDWFTFAPEQPVDLKNVELLTPVVQPGGSLRFLLTLHRKRLCPIKIDRVIKVASSGEPVWRKEEPGGAAAITDRAITYPMSVNLPSGLRPGEYTYESVNYSKCGDGLFYNVVKPIKFTIVP